MSTPSFTVEETEGERRRAEVFLWSARVIFKISRGQGQSGQVPAISTMKQLSFATYLPISLVLLSASLHTTCLAETHNSSSVPFPVSDSAFIAQCSACCSSLHVGPKSVSLRLPSIGY
ncbi:transmembrane protein 213 isoform 3-T3 [Sarcophilus harrisii]